MRKLIIKILLILTILPAYGQINTRVPFKILKGHQYKVMYLSFSTDSKYLASSSWDNTVRIWNMETFTEFHVLEGHQDWVREVNISADNKYILSGSQDASFILWELKTGKLKSKVEISPKEFSSKRFTEFDRKYKNAVCAVTFSQDGKYIAIGTTDSFIRIWELESMQLIHTLKGHNGNVFYIVFGKKDEIMVSGSFQNELIIWDTKTFKPLKILEEEKGYNGSFQLFQNNKYLVNTGNCMINVWDISKGEIIRSIPVQCDLQSVQLTPDEKYLITCAEDHTVKIWDFETEKELWTYYNPKPEIADCKISLDGKYLAVATPESVILIWEISELVNNK